MNSLVKSKSCRLYKYDTKFGRNSITHKINGREEIWTKGERIGAGGFGEVHLYSRGRADKQQLRAIKSIPPPSGRNDRRAIKRELKTLISLQGCRDRFVRFYGWCASDDQTVFIVMEYLAAGDLYAYTLSDPSRAKQNCRTICTQLLRALDIMHEMEICHRDLKPQNILIKSVSPLTLKLADFGIAKSTRHDASGMRTVVGTSRYMAPEVLGLCGDRATGQYYTKAVDMWSLGSIIYEILTGLAPFCYYDADISDVEDEETAAEDSSGEATDGTGAHSQQYHTAQTAPSVSVDLIALRRYCSGETSFPESNLDRASTCPSLKRLLQDLMQPDPLMRLSASDGLQHPWVVQGGRRYSVESVGDGRFEHRGTQRGGLKWRIRKVMRVVMGTRQGILRLCLVAFGPRGLETNLKTFFSFLHQPASSSGLGFLFTVFLVISKMAMVSRVPTKTEPLSQESREQDEEVQDKKASVSCPSIHEDD